MAWYHVNNCDCPIGCCDCGDSNYGPRYENFKTVVQPKPPAPKGKCSGCGLRSKDTICWRCSTTIEGSGEDELREDERMRAHLNDGYGDKDL